MRRRLTLAFVGPESTAKTTLSHWVASRLKVPWIEEAAREYLRPSGRNYCRKDVLRMGLLQLESETSVLAKCPLVVSDTHVLVYHVWMLDKFKEDSLVFHDILLGRSDIFYILTAPDIEWVFDPLREDPHRRHLIFRMYQREITRFRLPHHIVRGQGEARYAAVLSILRQLQLPLESNR